MIRGVNGLGGDTVLSVSIEAVKNTTTIFYLLLTLLRASNKSGTIFFSSTVSIIIAPSPWVSFTSSLYSTKPHPLVDLFPPGIGAFWADHRQAPGAKNIMSHFCDFSLAIKSSSSVQEMSEGKPSKGGRNSPALAAITGSHPRIKIVLFLFAVGFMSGVTFPPDLTSEIILSWELIPFRTNM